MCQFSVADWLLFPNFVWISPHIFKLDEDHIIYFSPLTVESFLLVMILLLCFKIASDGFSSC